MNPASEDIKDYLESSAVALGTFGTDLFIGQMPATPDVCIVIVDTAGFRPELNYEWERPGIQILVRGELGSYLTTNNSAKAVYTALHGICNETINTAVYKLIRAVSTPIYIGEDDNKRPLFSLNFEIQRSSV